MNSEMTHQRGVGLIEVLIASLVLAVAVVGTSMLLVDSVRSLSDASIRSDALLASADCLEAGRLDPGSCNATQSIASIRTDLTRNYSVAAVTEGSELGVSLTWNDAFNDDSARSMSAAVVVPDSARVIKPSLLVASLNIQSPGAGVSPPPSDGDDSGSDDESNPETDTDRVTNWTVSLSAYGDGSDGSDTVANGENAMVKVDLSSVPAGQVMTAATGCADATSVTVSGADTIFVSDVASNCTVTPVFSTQTYTVAASVKSGGSITPSSATVAHNGSTSFEVTFDTGKQFKEFKSNSCGAATMSGSTASVTDVTEDCAFEVETETAEYTVTVNGYGNNSDTVDYSDDAKVKVVDVPSGQVLSGATGCEAESSSVEIDADKEEIKVKDLTNSCSVTPVFEAIDTSWTGSVRVELTQYSSNKWFQILRPQICGMFGKNNGKKHNTTCSFTSDAASKSVTVTINIASQNFICTGKDTGAQGSWSTTLNISANNPNAKVTLVRRGGVGNCKGSDAAKITYSN